MHNLHYQLDAPHISGEVENEERILKIIRKLKGATIREIRQYTKLSIRQIQLALDGFIQADLVAKEVQGRMTKYTDIDEVEI